MNSLRLATRHLKPNTPRSITTAKMADSNYRISSIPGLPLYDLYSFPPFKNWLSTLQNSLARQKSPSHEFHKDPYVLRHLEIQAADRFEGARLGFVKLKATVSNGRGETLPGSVFLRGGSVGMLMVLQPDDIANPTDNDKRAILTIQPRIPAGSLAFPEIPAGMLDDSGTFAGAAAKEIQEETGLLVKQDDLIDMTALASQASQASQSSRDHSGESLQNAVYPSAGGSDEFIPLFLYQKTMPRRDIEALQGKLTGLRDEGEKITLKLVPLADLWKEGVRDGKTLAAWGLYQGLKSEGLL